MNREQALKHIFANRGTVLKHKGSYLKFHEVDGSSRLRVEVVSSWKSATIFDNEDKAWKKYSRVYAKIRKELKPETEKVVYWNLATVMTMSNYDDMSTRVFMVEDKIKELEDVEYHEIEHI